MSTIQSIVRILCVLLVAVFLLGITPAQAQTADAPAGLRPADWTQIQALMPPATIDAQQAYLKASNTDESDRFGYAVAISGDTVAVGASLEDSDATGVNGDPFNKQRPESGAVYVFTRSGSTWSQQAYIKASNPDWHDEFGAAVAISGDTLVVGATGQSSDAFGDDSAGSVGAAYVFTRSGTTWSQQAYLKASNAEGDDNFGWSVAISDDTIVVGAIGEASNATGVNGNQADNSANVSGAAYVFTRSGVTWSQQAYIKASNTHQGDYFGNAVAIAGNTLAVAAIHEDNDSGAVYIFARSATTWSQQAYLKASNKNQDDDFGIAVSLSGDTLVVGSPNEDGLDSDSGAAYVFTRSGVLWNLQAYLKAPITGEYNHFGGSVSISGDRLVVGEVGDDNNATYTGPAQNSGAAYVFIRNGNHWIQQTCLKASNADTNDQFGASVAISGETVVAGTYGESSNATGVDGDQADNSVYFAGAAYVFSVADTIAPTIDTFAADSPSATGLISITDFSASDNLGVIGYMITSSPTPPLAGANGWSDIPVWSYAVTSNGPNTLYPWAKDALGNVSAANGFPVTVSDNMAPTVGSITYTGDGTTSKLTADFDVCFSESMRMNVDKADFVVHTTGSITGASVRSVSPTSSLSCYSVTVNTGTGDGTLRLDVPAHANLTDLVGHLPSNLPYKGGSAYTVIKSSTNTSFSNKDGWILESSENSNVGGVLSRTGSLMVGDNATRQQYRSILSFYTGSILPKTAIITKITLKVRKSSIMGGGNPVIYFQGFMVDIKKGFFGSNPFLQASDFQATADKSYGPFKPALVNGWYSMDLTAAKAYINRIYTNYGDTQIRLRFKLDDNNNAAANQLIFFGSDSIYAYQARLIINYYVP